MKRTALEPMMGPSEARMKLRVEVECEDDGRWIAEVPDLSRRPLVRVVADRLDHGGETAPMPIELSFVVLTTARPALIE